MKNITIVFLVAFLVTMCLSSNVQAKYVTRDEAMTIANNWITYMIHKTGDWNGSKIAFVDEILELKRGDRLLGYYCAVVPDGFVIVSLLRELSPVKAYSTSTDLDPYLDEGMTDLLKSCMERVLDPAEDQLGPLDAASSDDLGNVLGTTNRRAWQEIEQGVDMNYQEGDTLVDSKWHQGDPYNYYCPAPPQGSDCTDPHCLVGCVATAGAQIMKYWSWPPYGIPAGWNDTYDWVNMPNILTPTSPQAQIEATAELCYEIGVAVGMGYCDTVNCQSSAVTSYMANVYQNYYRYYPFVNVLYRAAAGTPINWFETIKAQINYNRPIHYRVVGHSIVCDGWREIGSTPIRQYHMNYGWANDATCWYTLDSLIYGDPSQEYMLTNIFPTQSIQGSLGSNYPLPSFPYRYFDRDASGTVSSFDAGHYLQFLPHVKVTCTAGTGNNIRFLSTIDANSHMFTRGDVSRGARLQGGAIKLYSNGGIRFD
jgi:hypothetical protein